MDVSVISGVTNTVVATIKLEGSAGLYGIGFDSLNGEIYIPSTTYFNATWIQSSVYVISTATNEVVTMVNLTAPNQGGQICPGAMPFDSSNGDVYVPGCGETYVLSGSTNSVVAEVGVSAGGAIFDSSNGNIYVAQEDASSVTVLSGATNAIIASVPIGGYFGNIPTLVIDPLNGDIYAAGSTTSPSSATSGTVSVISGATDTLVSTIAVGGDSTGLAFDPVNGYIYATGSGGVSVISGITNTVISTVEPSVLAQYVASDPINAEIYVVGLTRNYLGYGGPSAVVVISEATTTSVNCSPSSVDINKPTTCTATVSTQGSGGMSPTGSIAWSSSGSGVFSATSCSLNSTQCSVTYTPSSHATPVTITANYGGDHTDLSSSNSTELVVRASTTTTVRCSLLSGAVGSPASCTATVTGTSPTGTISWSSNGRGTFSTASCTLSAEQCSVTYAPSSYTPSVTITAAYGGDFYNSVSSNTFATTFTTFSTATTVRCTPSPLTVGASASCTATVTGQSVDGTVAWSTLASGTFFATSCDLSTGSCLVQFETTGAGYATIDATYGGDSTYASSTGTITISVSKSQSSTDVTCSPQTVAVGASTSCTVTVTGYDPSSTVAWSIDASGTLYDASCTLSAASCSITYIPTFSASSTKMTATYSGDQNNLGSSSVPFSLNVGAVTTTASAVTTTASAVTTMTSSSGRSSGGSSGIPEFPAQLGFTLLVTVAIVATYVAIRRITVPARALEGHPSGCPRGAKGTATAAGDTLKLLSSSASEIKAERMKKLGIRAD
ncbi:MAG: hypothetical protein ACLP9K_09260 [Nitrososphaerales archaeon]